MIEPKVRQEIERRIAAAETEHNVRVLLAVESGSRAWGFESPDSDYDVRFVYAHEPVWYQRIDLEEQRDVIEYPIVDEVDINGWDVRKALRLFWKSNPAFIEWIQSPIVYSKAGSFHEQVTTALPDVFDPLKGVYHYRSMANSNFRTYLRGDSVRLKKYLYVMRPLLAAMHIEQHLTPPPIELSKLQPILDGKPEVAEALRKLVQQKMSAPELGEAPPIPVLNEFIEQELANGSGELPRRAGIEVSERLTSIYRNVINESWK